MSLINNYIEVVEVIKNNKLRTALTGFSVMWGIWILLIMLGTVQGFFNANKQNMGNRSVNSITIFPGETSMPYAGYKVGRRIDLTQQDLDALCLINRKIIGSTLIINNWGPVVHGEDSEACNMIGAGPIFEKIDGAPIYKGNGRFINDIDEHHKRKVAVIDQSLKKSLFPDKDPIGEKILIKDIPFTVIGTHSGKVSWGMSNVIIPYNTARVIFTNNDRWYRIRLLIDHISTAEANDALKKQLQGQLAKIKKFDPTDKNAIFINSEYDNAKQFEKMTTAMSLFFWIIGCSILAVGIMGVSNIMLISVKERTNEIGIRKALGAKPSSIISMIVFESLLITLIFGYIGLFLGIGSMELIDYLITKYNYGAWNIGGVQGGIFLNPTINLSVAISATIVIVIAGALAGFFPARKAAKITAIDAMKN